MDRRRTEFNVPQGDDKVVTFPVTEDGDIFDLSAATDVVFDYVACGGGTAVRKSLGGDVALVGDGSTGIFTVTFPRAESDLLDDTMGYSWQARVKTSGDQVDTVAWGLFTVSPEIKAIA